MRVREKLRRLGPEAFLLLQEFFLGLSSESSNLFIVSFLTIDGRAGDGDGWPGRLAWTRAAIGRTRRVGATILAVCDAQVSVLRLILDAVDGFDGVRDVRKVDKGTVPEVHCHNRVTLMVALPHTFLLGS